jgi:hypothetical protein
MKETRQIECVGAHDISAKNFSVAFWRVHLLLATPNSMLQEVKPKVKKGITA